MVVLDISGAVKSIHAVNKNHSRWIEPLLSKLRAGEGGNSSVFLLK